MKDLLEISCGLDIHKEKIVACILTGPLGKPTHSEIREFTTFNSLICLLYETGSFQRIAIILQWKALAFIGFQFTKY